MSDVTVEGVLASKIVVSACASCRAFWFEPFETEHLTRGSTLLLFKMIADQGAASTTAFPTVSHCPVCSRVLVLTHDWQRSTAFQYWRCDQGHGRFTSFVDFLREKDFIKPLTPQQINDLRQNIQMVSCSNCGAPIDLANGSVCPHCGAALSMLDMAKLKQLTTGPVHPAAPQPTAADHDNHLLSALVASRLASAEPHPQRPSNLIDLGLQTVVQWLRDALEQ